MDGAMRVTMWIRLIYMDSVNKKTSVEARVKECMC